MNRTLDIIISTLMWCAIVGYIVAAGSYSRSRRAEVRVERVHIVVTDTAHTKVVSREKATKWLSESGVDPIGLPANEADTRSIEEQLSAHPEVRRASVWTDLEGNLTVRIEQRIPLLRIRTTDGYRFWFTRDGVIVPDRGDFGAYVPVVTGSAAFPFPISASGSYLELQRAEYNDFLGQFTEIETTRRSLDAGLSAVRADIRSTRSQGPRRFWGEARKKTFNEEKNVHLAELDRQRNDLERQLSSLASKKGALVEKEKKSYQSFGFLPKLANFVKFIESNDFWAAQIVQINLLDKVVSTGSGSSNSWHEPQLELVPRAGDHTVLLGRLDGSEREKLEKLKLFYLEGLWHEGWGKYKYIDIRYKDQIVCTK